MGNESHFIWSPEEYNSFAFASHLNLEVRASGTMPPAPSPVSQEIVRLWSVSETNLSLHLLVTASKLIMGFYKCTNIQKSNCRTLEIWLSGNLLNSAVERSC